MADNEYYNRLSEMNPGELADGLAMEAEFDAIARGFERLPTPHLDGHGFEEPIRVGDAVNADEAVTKAQLDKALGKAKSLAIATYGDLNAAAWATLDSGTYLLFGTGAQLTNFPATLVAGATYYVTVRHAVGDVGVSLYLDELAFASTDDAANVDLGRVMVRVGADLTTVISAGWKKAQPLDATLTAIAGVATAADKLVYFDGVDSAKAAPFTAFARSLLDDVDAPTAIATLGAVATTLIIPAGADLNTYKKTGTYCLLSSALNMPTGGDYYSFVEVIYNQGVGVQVFTNYTDARRWVRSYNLNVSSWTPWMVIYTQNSILGPVSQASGVPTGAIIERGSNANGVYTKFASGLVICSFRTNYNVSVPPGGEFTAPTWVLPVVVSSRLYSNVRCAFYTLGEGTGNGLYTLPYTYNMVPLDHRDSAFIRCLNTGSASIGGIGGYIIGPTAAGSLVAEHYLVGTWF